MYAVISDRTFSGDGCKSRENLLCLFPEILLPDLQIHDVCLINAARLVGLFGILIQVIAADPQEPHHFPDVRKIEGYDIAVNRHLAQKRRLASDICLLHPAADSVTFSFCHPEVQLYIPLPHGFTLPCVLLCLHPAVPLLQVPCAPHILPASFGSRIPASPVLSLPAAPVLFSGLSHPTHY